MNSCHYPTLRQHGIDDPIALVRRALERGLGKPAPPQETKIRPPKNKSRLFQRTVDAGRSVQ